jgi:DNA mismatch endonuclease (patch repair protein)
MQAGGRRLLLITDRATSVRLAMIRQKDTAPEIEVQQRLRSAGVRFRTSGKRLAGTPDLYSISNKWAVFVHGCFWHGHAGCRRATLPKRNRSFWVDKLRRNTQRDRRKIRVLRDCGFSVFVIWECQLGAKPSAVATRMVRRLMLLQRFSSGSAST